MGVVVATRTATSLWQSAWTTAVSCLMHSGNCTLKQAQKIMHYGYHTEKQTKLQGVFFLTGDLRVDTRSENRWTAGQFVLKSDRPF